MFRKKARFDPVGRNRPLTNKQQAGVFSYYSQRSPGSSNTRKAKFFLPNANKIKYLPTILAALAIIVSLLYSLSVDTYPKVLLYGSKEKVRSIHEYQDIGSSILKKSIFSRTKLTLNDEALILGIKQQFPEVTEASVKLALISRRPVIELVVSSPVIKLGSSGKVFAINSDGKAILEIDSSAHSALPLIQDESSLTPQVGGRVLTPGDVTFIRQLYGQLQQKSLVVESASLPPVPSELHVRLKGQPYYIKFNLLGDARLQAGTFLAVKQRFETDKTIPGEYVDVRVEEKAFFK